MDYNKQSLRRRAERRRGRRLMKVRGRIRRVGTDETHFGSGSQWNAHMTNGHRRRTGRGHF